MPWRDKWLWATVVVQLLLVGYAFWGIVSKPADMVLYADYDGGKNYFTPYSYVSGLGVPASQAHPLKVYGQHYPFGEYVFYTDNTPLVSLPLRLAAKLGVPMPHGGTAALNYFFLLSQWLAAPLLYLLLVQLSIRNWLAAAFAPALTWGCKQYWHLNIGSPNLGLTSLTLLFLLGLFSIYRQPTRWSRWLAVGALIGIAAWLHLYYLIIFGTALALFAAVLLLRSYLDSAVLQRQALLALGARAAVAGVLALSLIYLPLRLIDQKYALRTGAALGYNYDSWKLDLRSLITPWPEYKTRFLVSYAETIFGERSGYLGLWFLYGLLLVLLLLLIDRRQNLQERWARLRVPGFAVTLGLVGTLLFFAALGDTYRGRGEPGSMAGAAQSFLCRGEAFCDASAFSGYCPLFLCDAVGMGLSAADWH